MLKFNLSYPCRNCNNVYIGQTPKSLQKVMNNCQKSSCELARHANNDSHLSTLNQLKFQSQKLIII